MAREVSTCEELGTVIYHQFRPSTARIVGAYKGGFIVDVFEGQKGRCMLPFTNLENWRVK